LYIGGVTSDNDLRGFTHIVSPTPIIMRYIWSGITNSYTVGWGRTIITSDNYVLNAITASSKLVAGNIYSPTADSLIFVLRFGNTYFFVYRYPNSINSSNLYKRNILLGLMTDALTYRLILGSKFKSNTGADNGFQII
jgi:hypothetical protein